MSLSHADQILLPIYVTIGNLDVKMRWSQNRLKTLLLDSIPIAHELAEVSNNKNKCL